MLKWKGQTALHYYYTLSLFCLHVDLPNPSQEIMNVSHLAREFLSANRIRCIFQA